MRNTHNKIKNLKQYENADANNVCESLINGYRFQLGIVYINRDE